MTREETLDKQFDAAVERTLESLGLIDVEPDYDSVICPFCNDLPPECDCDDFDGFVEILNRPITGGLWL